MADKELVNEIRPTALEERLGAYRTLFSVALAHLANNGLVDIQSIEADCLAITKAAGSYDHAESDLNDIFGIAEELCEAYKNRLASDRQAG